MFGRRARDWRKLWTQSIPALTEITSVDEAPEAPSLLNANGLRAIGSSAAALCILAASRSASYGRWPHPPSVSRWPQRCEGLDVVFPIHRVKGNDAKADGSIEIAGCSGSVVKYHVA